MSRIGRYEVEAEVGRGAMGRVYLATDPRLRRRVAVKVHSLPQGLKPEQQAEYGERFLREAQAAAKLTHPGIVTVYDADEDPERGLPFIAMEYVEGSSLRELLDDGERLDAEQTLATGGALAEALQSAHDAGIVHRDIKPANILVRAKDGAAKIADFGIARLSTSELTRSGMSLGSPAYMSPEQVRGRPIDGRSDLFSLAVVLYECFCGLRPFTGEDFTALAYATVHETPVPITRRAPDLPAGLDRFFDRALAKEPEERFESGAAFKQALLEAFRERNASDPASTVIDRPASSTGPRGDSGLQAWATDVEAGPFRDSDRDDGRKQRRRIFVAATLLLLVLFGWMLFGGGKGAYLKLDARSSVESGSLSLLVDGDRVYSRSLKAPKQKKNLIKKILDQRHETFEAWIEVSPGKHEVVAELVTQGPQKSELRDTIVVDLEPGETRRLRMTAGRAFGSGLNLKAN